MAQNQKTRHGLAGGLPKRVMLAGVDTQEDSAKAAPPQSFTREMFMHDGRGSIGRIVERGGELHAFDAIGEELGIFALAELRAAMRSISGASRSHEGRAAR